MKKIMISSLAVGLMFSVAVLNSGCAAFRADTRMCPCRKRSTWCYIRL